MTIKLDLLLIGKCVLTLGSKDKIFDGAVGIKDNKIIAVGKRQDLEEKYKYRRLISHKNSVIMPGFVNCHTHDTLTRGLAEDLPLMEWLEKICFPIEKSYTAEDMYVSAEMNQLELIKAGITTYLSIFRKAEQSINVAKKSGLRAIYSPQVVDDFSQQGESLTKTEKLLKDYHGIENNRIQVWFGVHAPYSNGPETYKKAVRLADKYNVGVHTHLAETRDEVQFINEKYGVSPTQYLKQQGVFEVPNVLAHCIYVDGEDMELMAENKDMIGIAYNPISNTKMAAGVAPVTELLQHDLNIGIGTDSNLSNNSLDMMEEMRIGAYQQKLYSEDPSVLPCESIIKMATSGGANILGMGDSIGSIEVGKKADLITIDFNSPHMWPIYWDDPGNIIEQIVYSAKASDVITTIVDGEVLMDNRNVETLNEEEVFNRVQKTAHDLYNRTFGC